MKNYANRNEIELFTLILAFEVYLDNFSKCELISESELKSVKTAMKNLHVMTESIKERLGLVFLKKIKKLLDCNHLGFYAKGIVRDKVINHIDDSVLIELLEDAGWNMDCIGCEKENHTECRCYRIFVEMGKEGNGKATGCPFK